jgi:hypothetical protein
MAAARPRSASKVTFRGQYDANGRRVLSAAAEATAAAGGAGSPTPSPRILRASPLGEAPVAQDTAAAAPGTVDARAVSPWEEEDGDEAVILEDEEVGARPFLDAVSTA